MKSVINRIRWILFLVVFLSALLFWAYPDERLPILIMMALAFINAGIMEKWL